MSETIRDGFTGKGIGAGDILLYRGALYMVDSWSVGAGVIWLRQSVNRDLRAHDVEVKAQQVGCYVGYFGDYSIHRPRWRPDYGIRLQGPPDFDSLPPAGVATLNEGNRTKARRCWRFVPDSTVRRRGL